MEIRSVDVIVEIPAVKKQYSASGALVNLSGGVTGQKLLAGSQYKFNLVLNGSEDIN